MRDLSRQVSRFISLSMKSLTQYPLRAFNVLEIWNKFMPQLSLRPRFLNYAREDMPGGVTASGFRHESYVGISSVGPEQTIHELLVDLKGQDNETFFTDIAKSGQGAVADSYLVFKALDHAKEKNLFPVAINIYLESACNYDFIDSVTDYLNAHCLSAGDVVFELLEHDIPSAGDDLSAIGYACEKGIRFALDDFDPRVTGQIERLEILAPYCSFIKFDKKALWDFKAGLFEALPEVVKDIRSEHPLIQFIAEGVDQAFIKENELDFDKTQYSGWGDFKP